MTKIGICTRQANSPFNTPFCKITGARVATADTISFLALTASRLVEDCKALFLTEDKAFVDRLFWNKQYRYGVVLIRLGDLPSVHKSRVVVQAIQAHGPEMPGAITAITSKAVRVRRFAVE